MTGVVSSAKQSSRMLQKRGDEDTSEKASDFRPAYLESEMSLGIDGTAQSYKPLEQGFGVKGYLDHNNFRNSDTDGDGKLSLGEQLFKEHGVEHSGGKVQGKWMPVWLRDRESGRFLVDSSGYRTEAEMSCGQETRVMPTGSHVDGTVTRAEFFDFVESRRSNDFTFEQWQRLEYNAAQTFKKLDVNRDGVLDRSEAGRLNAGDLNRDLAQPAPSNSGPYSPSLEWNFGFHSAGRCGGRKSGEDESQR
jgi:hypothetical protein